MPTNNGFHSSIESPTGSATGTNLKIELNITWDYSYNWQANWQVIDQGNNYKVGDVLTIPRPSGLPVSQIFSGTHKFTITKIGINETERALKSINMFDRIADYVMFPGMETRSHQSGPEHEIVYVNELINTTHNKASYESLAIGGIRINSAKEWTNFTQLSAYFKKGIKIPDLIHGSPPNYLPKKASNNFAEIAFALLTDENLGAGKLVGVNAVGDMVDAAKFCYANGFTWDGMISNKINLREFLYQHGIYNLLDFTVIGGKFNLIPSVPYKEGSYQIDHDQKVNISALFTDGNIKDLQVSFLSPEERQMFQAHIMYRKEKANAFAETKSLVFRLKDDHGGSPTDPIETFDLSGFCTTEEHAIKFAKHILKIRKEVDHGLTFKTAPQYCVNLSPGKYIRLVSEASHVDRYANGVITEDGQVISKDTITETNADIYYWKPGTTEVLEKSGVNFVTGANLPTDRVLFTLKETVTSNKVYKIETISYSEDGLIEISGSHAPLTDTGSLAILDGWDGALSHFTPVS